MYPNISLAVMTMTRRTRRGGQGHHTGMRNDLQGQGHPAPAPALPVPVQVQGLGQAQAQGTADLGHAVVRGHVPAVKAKDLDQTAAAKGHDQMANVIGQGPGKTKESRVLGNNSR